MRESSREEVAHYTQTPSHAPVTATWCTQGSRVGSNHVPASRSRRPGVRVETPRPGTGRSRESSPRMVVREGWERPLTGCAL